VSEKPITHGETAVKIPTISVAHFACSALENAKLAIAIAGASIQAVHRRDAPFRTRLDNNGQRWARRLNYSAAFDPTATLAVHCGNGFDAGFNRGVPAGVSNPIGIGSRLRLGQLAAAPSTLSERGRTAILAPSGRAPLAAPRLRCRTD
jgi:hypothetical protein